MTAAAIRRLLPLGFVAVGSVWQASRISMLGDWAGDTWPAVHALGHGHMAEYVSAKAMMGPFATLVQAPFALLGGGDMLSAYRWAAVPCLLTAGLVGLYLATVAGRRGAPRAVQALIAVLCLVNPLSFAALQNGHPEELLATALAIGAVATASEGHRRRAALLLGLALASKQWAVIAIAPTLMALPGHRLRPALGAAIVAGLLILPGLLAAPGSFSDVQGSAASTPRYVSPWSVWYPLRGDKTEVVHAHGMRFVAHIHENPPLVGSLTHPLIVLLAVALPLGLARRRGSFRLSGCDAMGLLALLALLRCALDPVDNLYYHLPLLVAVIGWDALAPQMAPLRTLAGTASALFLAQWSLRLLDTESFNAMYVSVASLVGLGFALSLLRPAWWLRIQGSTAPAARMSYEPVGIEQAIGRGT